MSVDSQSIGMLSGLRSFGILAYLGERIDGKLPQNRSKQGKMFFHINLVTD